MEVEWGSIWLFVQVLVFVQKNKAVTSQLELDCVVQAVRQALEEVDKL